MDPDLRKGISAFNIQNYFEAHEHFESFWNNQHSSDRGLAQGLAQIAAVFHLIKQDRIDGARKAWTRAEGNLSQAFDGYQGIKLSKLKRETQLFLARTGNPNLRQAPKIIPH